VIQSLTPRRVVVTGIGAITSLATNARDTWQKVLNGETGIRRADNLNADKHKCVLRGDVDDSQMPQRFLSPKELRNTSRYSRMALEAAGEALMDAGLLDDEYNPTIDMTEAGTSIGNCIGGTYDDMLPVHEQYIERDGKPRVPPHLHVMFPHNIGSYTIQKRFGMMGPSSTVVTACATGSQAIGDGFHAVKFGKAPMMIAGAMESTQHPLFELGFEAMRALCTDSNDDPDKASRPFNADRAGFILGEGAGMLLLEDLEHAQARGAKIYCEIAGYATSNDAYHPIAPEPNGEGAARAIREALEDAGMAADEIDHVNAHAASTPAGDLAEANAIKAALGEERGSAIPVTSLKGAFGHAMAAAGAMESVMAVLTLFEGKIPPTRNHTDPDPEVGLNIVSEAKDAVIRAMTKHSFGLGGQNAALVLKAWNPAGA
jgi:3-oxoacyl-[acyl-carrier-protein] synthase II